MEPVEIIEKLEEEMGILLGALEAKDPAGEEYKEIVERIKTIEVILSNQRKSVADVESFKKEGKHYVIDKVVDGAKIAVELTGIVLPIVFYGAWLKMGFQFEKEGIITSQTFKGFIGKFKPSK